MTNWDSIEVKETDTERALCDCCRSVTITANGDLFHLSSCLGFYSVRFSESSEHPPVISIWTGDWSENAQQDTRWGARAVWYPEGCGLLDWTKEEKSSISSFTPLDRDEVLKTNFADEFWTMIDAIIMKNSRLERFH